MDEHDRADDAGGLPPIHSVLEELAATDSGIGFIYSALELLAVRYQIRDAAVVLVNESFGTQMFRLEGRVVSADMVGELGSHPGVYCTPDVVPRAELEAVYSACQQSFSSQLVRFNTTHNTSTPREEPRDEADALEPLRSRSQDNLEEPTATTKPYAPPSRRVAVSTRARTTRALISKFLLLIDVAVFFMTVGGVHGPVRLVLGLILGVVIPGWCVVGLLRLDNVALEFGLTAAVSLSLLMVTAQILMTIDLWHLIALEEVTCVVCLPFLIFQARGRRPTGRRSR
ncbi:MAG TPA: hypothetical protein VNF08_06920 [Acidimicrobiales bacterium]|nr:hypothetical protein [Acidimicrobiales bacterium]